MEVRRWIKRVEASGIESRGWELESVSSGSESTSTPRSDRRRERAFLARLAEDEEMHEPQVWHVSCPAIPFRFVARGGLVFLEGVWVWGWVDGRDTSEGPGSGSAEESEAPDSSRLPLWRSLILECESVG
jgi:hypothetical protein